MSRTVCGWAAAAVMALTAGCGFEIGPAHPERDGGAYLRKHGYPAELVDAVLKGGPLSQSDVVRLGACRSADVRFLVAANTNLAQPEIDAFIRDRNDFVRSGAARNPGLSPAQIATLAADPSHTVYCSLAGNEALSDEELLRIHTTRNPGLVWFALNPNCPDSIRREILDSNDSFAKDWLGTVDGWKNSGVYVRDSNGRWRKVPKAS
ncbi:MAG: hypothetical protein FJ221_06365 [Lentisphaerae bacterium]|nr:hypothetical protein [Lentisphaerota bacterium]